MNIGYVSCKDTNAVVFLIAQITFLEAHLVIGMWLPCSGDTVRWWEMGKSLFFSFGFIALLPESSATSDSRLVLRCP